MFTISHNGRILFDPRIDGYPLGNPKLSREANKIGTLSFTIYPGHPEYSLLKSISSVLTVYKDGQIYWQGRPAYHKRTFKGGIDYRCEELTARLNDFKLRPTTYTGTVSGFITFVLASYNARASVPVSAGNITVTGNVSYTGTEYTGHWDVLQSALVGDFGGYIIPRYESGGLYLDYLTDDDLPDSQQGISFGENMTDLFIETSADDTFSVLVPLGATVNGEKVTIKSVNDGKDYIEHAAGKALYGARETTYEWPDVTEPAELKALAEDYLDEIAVKFKETVKLTAVDLRNTGADIASFDYLTWIHAESTLHGLSADYVATREDIPLGTPTGTAVTLGATSRTFTDTVTGGISTSEAAAVAAQNAAGSAQSSASSAAASAVISEQILAAIVGTQGSNALFILSTDSSDRNLITVNPNYRFVVGQYDVESTFDTILGGNA